MGRDDRLGHAAEFHHGVVSRLELYSVGLDRAAASRRLVDGSLIKVGARAYRLRGAPRTEHARALAAVINTPGRSYLSHSSAAWLWELPGFQLEPCHIARRYEGTRRPAGEHRVHNLRGVPEACLGEYLGIPVASPALTLFQVAAICHPARTGRAVDSALVMGLTDLVTLHSLLKALAARGRNGIVSMRRILAERPVGSSLVESGNERRFQDIVDRIDVQVERQVRIGSADSFITRVDFRDREFQNLIYRIQSERWHSAKSHRGDDLAQHAALVAAGFTVIDVWDRDMWGKSSKVEETVLRARFDAASS